MTMTGRSGGASEGPPDGPLNPNDIAWADGPEVLELIRGVPAFVARYLDLIEQADGLPGSEVAFTEFADFVSELASLPNPGQPTGLAECMRTIEKVAATSEDAEDLIGWSFLDYLSLDARRAVLAVLGPVTRKILETVEDPGGSSD
jgi:hypothetical protein